MSNRISLAVIVKPDDQEAIHLQRLLQNVSPFVDEVCVTVTGDNANVEKVANEYHANLSHTEWTNDFSAARSFNFNQCTGDWVLWLDADDTLTGGEKLRSLIKEGIDGYYFPYEYAFDANANCIDQHWKLQFLRNDGHFEWRGAIHENPIPLRPARHVKVEAVRRIHHADTSRATESYERNLSILEAEAAKNPEEPRNLFYLGRTYYAAKKYEKCVEVLTRYLDLSGWDDERYEASLLIGNCYKDTGDLETAIEWYHRSILEKEAYPDAYFYKGLTYLQRKDWLKALYNFRLALQLEPQDGVTFYNPMNWKRDIFAAAALAYLHVGDIKQALLGLKKALAADPKHRESLELYQLAKSIDDKNELALKYVDIAKSLGSKEKVQKLLATIPSFLSDHEYILALSAKFQPQRKWGEKTIAVYCGPTAEPWTPENLGNGIGGSETAVIELTKRLAKQGWKVTVFNECNAPAEEPLVFDRVTYENYWKFNPYDEYDVLWVWRIPELFDFDLKARVKILDLHDTMTPADFTPKRVERMDKIFVKTNYHRSLYKHVPDEKFVVVGNGIDLSRFNGEVEKEPYRFAYTSTPNRGLDIVLKMWPKIKEDLPEAELHVYYGWNTFYELEKDNPERMAWMKKTQAMMNQPGIVDHGRVGQKELAQDLLKTSFWLYPTYFPEIDCITAKEMQAAGVICITSGYAALAESQQSGLKLPGDVYDPKWQDSFVEQVLLTVEKGTMNDPREVAKQFSWDLVADKWHKELC